GRGGGAEDDRAAEPEGVDDVVGDAVGAVVDVGPQLGVDDGDHRPGNEQQRHHPAAAGRQALEYQRDAGPDDQLDHHGDGRVVEGEHQRVTPERGVKQQVVVTEGKAVEAE